MQAHHWEKASGYDVVVSKGFTSLKPLAFTAPADEAIHNFRHPVIEKTRIAQMVFGGFTRCLYPVQKFQSDTERVMSVILDREATKWFKPGRGQFQLFYKWGSDQREYQPDFVAETTDAIYMLEPKMRKEIEDGEGRMADPCVFPDGKPFSHHLGTAKTDAGRWNEVVSGNIYPALQFSTQM